MLVVLRTVTLRPLSTGVLLGPCVLSRDEPRCDLSGTWSPTVATDEMGLGGSTLQRAASEIIGFPSARTDENSSEHGEAGADRSSEHHNTFPVALNKSPADGGMTPLKRSARLKDSRGTLARCDTDGKDRTASNDGSCESTTRQSSRRGALSRSLADRIESPEFTPFGGSTVSEQPAFVPIPVDTVTPPEPFDADFMMSGTTRAVRSDGSSGKSLGPTVEAPTARKACDNCVRRKTRCDRNIPCAHCINRNEKCHQSAPTPRHAKTVSRMRRGKARTKRDKAGEQGTVTPRV